MRIDSSIKLLVAKMCLYKEIYLFDDALKELGVSQGRTPTETKLVGLDDLVICFNGCCRVLHAGIGEAKPCRWSKINITCNSCQKARVQIMYHVDRLGFVGRIG